MPKHHNLKGSLILCITALIWGLAFVAQSGAAKLIPPFVCNSLRSLIAAAALFLFFKVTNRAKEPFFPKEPVKKKQVLKIALICGCLFTLATNIQQAGFALYPNGVASEARAGFLTALYVVIVPILSVFFGKRIHLILIPCVLITVAGVYLLCAAGGFHGFYAGDVLMLLCAFGFSMHILAVDRFVAVTGGVRLAIMQFTICGVLSGILSLLFEKPIFTNLLAAIPQILYLGLFSSGIAYTLQIVGQKYAEPAIASLVMSLESVFAALGGWLLAGNALSPAEVCGCVLVFAAIVLAQLPELLESRKEKNKGRCRT